MTSSMRSVNVMNKLYEDVFVSEVGTFPCAVFFWFNTQLCCLIDDIVHKSHNGLHLRPERHVSLEILVQILRGLTEPFIFPRQINQGWDSKGDSGAQLQF